MSYMMILASYKSAYLIDVWMLLLLRARRMAAQVGWLRSRPHVQTSVRGSILPSRRPSSSFLRSHNFQLLGIYSCLSPSSSTQSWLRLTRNQPRPMISYPLLLPLQKLVNFNSNNPSKNPPLRNPNPLLSSRPNPPLQLTTMTI